MKNNMVVTILLLIIFTGGGFFAGTKYQQSKSPVLGQFNDRQGGMNARGGGQQNGNRKMGGGQVVGEIMSVDDKSITVKMTDGSSKIVLLVDNTNINKASTASKSDLMVGEKVAIFGTTTTDGSVTATNIQLNPIIRERPTAEPTK